MAFFWPMFFFAPRAFPMDFYNLREIYGINPKNMQSYNEKKKWRWLRVFINSTDFTYGTGSMREASLR